MTERRPLTSLFGVALKVRDLRPHEIKSNALFNSVAIVRADNGGVVATVDRDDLFDRDGNRFHDDTGE